MALNSVLSPEKITGKSNKSVLSAQNFISGGSSLGSSVFGGAANKIVNFQRSGVQPSPVDVGSIIRSISAGVVNNYNNQAQNINNSVTNIISKSISNLSKDYQDRIKKVDEAKPTGVLQKILGLYKDVIGFIQFFGNRKFVDKLRDNLKALQTSFTESFEVAKIVRQVIVKIVKQLSNLPKANPSGSSGLNVDVDIPGGGLKKSAPRGLGRMMRRVGGKGRMLALGAGALGLGAAGGAAVNALSGSDDVQPGGAAPEIPGNIVDSLSSIIDRFARAIDSLVKGGSGKTSGSSSGSSSGSAEKPAERGAPGAPGAGAPGAPGAGAPGAPGAPGGNVTGVGTPEQQALLKSISFAEGTTGSYGTIFGGKNVPELEKGQLTVKEVYDMMNSGSLKGRNVGYASGSRATGKYQFMPDTLSDIIKSGAIKWEEKFTPEAQDRAILSRTSSLRGVTPELLKREGLSANVSDKLAPEFASFPTKSGASYYGQSVKSLSSIQKVYAQSLKQPTAQAPTSQAAPQAQVQAAPQLQTQVAQRAAAVSQPAQTQPQVNYLPIDMGGGQQPQQSGGGGLSVPPSQAKGGPTVPLLSATNTDNFLVLYSRMVYNIVDG